MTATQIIKDLKPLGTDGYKRVLMNHGVKEPVIGVKIEALKKIQKKVKKDYQLALDLYDTRIYDAQYLAGLIADETKMTKKDLSGWLEKANCSTLCSFTVAWVAAESAHGLELARKWIDSKDEQTAQAGWATLSSIVAIKDDADLDLTELKQLLKRVEQTIHDQRDDARYAMNSFVIAVGSYVSSLTSLAIETGKKIGTVTVDMGNTSCQVPYSPDYIEKVKKRGTIGKKRKTARC